MGRDRQASFRAKWCAARAAADAVPSGLDAYQLALWLRARHPAETARLAAELCALAPRAATKFATPSRAVYTRAALEQATALAVARDRAREIAALAPAAAVLDLTCGAGADALALFAAGLDVLAADRDFERAVLADLNLEWAGAPGRAVVADAERVCARAPFAVLDPDRRPHGRRTLDPAAWQPSFARALEIARGFEGACLKLAPAIDLARLPAGPLAECAHRWQWTSLAGELVETSLWTGSLARGEPGVREARLLAAAPERPPRVVRGRPIEVAALAPADVPRAAWLAEPDAAVIRSGLVGWVAREWGLAPLAPEIAYLAGFERPREGPFELWRVVATCAADARRVRAMLALHDVGEVAIRKRGHPERAEQLARKWRGRGGRPGHLAVARLERGHVALLLEDPGAPAGEAPSA